ncbi:hypothetical protein KDK82_1972 [Delftia sp. K82]|nr:hypothetical protein KDK82_1972 [Delftia sp. K82]
MTRTPVSAATKRHMSVAAEFRSLSDELDDLPPVVVRSRTEPQASRADEPQPVLLLQQRLKIEGQERPAHEPSELALDFMRWVQKGLVDRAWFWWSLVWNGLRNPHQVF